VAFFVILFLNKTFNIMTVSVPTNINDITLGEFQKFDVINIENQDSDFLLHKTIEIFCGIDLNIVSKFPLKDAEDIESEIAGVLSQETPHTTQFELEGVKYGFIPDLSQMSLGEYIDLEDALKETKTFHKAMSVMYRPIVKSFSNLYTIESYDASPDRQELMKSAPLGIASSAVVFFYHIVKELLEVSQHYSKTLEEESLTILEKHSSPKNMDGLTASMHFLRVVSQNLKQ
tara:strand:+ start:1318 stop:2010 length:693 start_codon:yes stop_codon:yes gene_type:complete